MLYNRTTYCDGSLGGVEANTLQVLLALSLRPDATTQSLASDLLLDRSTVSHAVRTLMNAGLIRQAPNPDDLRRRHGSSPTPAGIWFERFSTAVS